MKLKKNNVYIVRLKQDTQKILADLDIMDGVVFNGNVSNEIMGNAQKCVPIYVEPSWLLAQLIIRKQVAII